MASSADGFVIVKPDGSLMADIYGNVAEFNSREETERWLLPGERADTAPKSPSSPAGPHARE